MSKDIFFKVAIIMALAIAFYTGIDYIPYFSIEQAEFLRLLLFGFTTYSLTRVVLG